MESKVGQRAASARENRVGRCGSLLETLLFKRGWDTHQNAGFYRHLRRSPEAITAAALAAKFGRS